MLEVRVLRKDPQPPYPSARTGEAFSPVWGVYDTNKSEFVRTSLDPRSKRVRSAYGAVYETPLREDAESLRREFEKQAVSARQVVNQIELAMQDEIQANTDYMKLGAQLRGLGYTVTGSRVESMAADEARHRQQLEQINQEIRRDYGIWG